MKPVAMLILVSFAVSAPYASAQEASPRQLASTCFACHGTDGHSLGGIPPGLAGRDAGELFSAMKAFQSGQRPATIMHQHARGYSDAQLQAIAGYFASVKPAAARAPAKP